MKKQQGFGLIETIISLAIMSMVLTFVIQSVNKYNDMKKSKAYAVYIERVITQLQKYQYNQITVNKISPSLPTVWPTTLEGLMTGSRFWPQCSIAEEHAHHCQRPDNVPWTTQPLGYTVTSLPSSPPKANIIIPSPPALWLSPLQRIPFAVTQPNGDIKISVDDPLLSQAFNNWLKKDGSTELTKTWDVGDQSILNAKEISVKTQANTQLRIDTGTVKEFLAQNNDHVYKNTWSCPQGLRQTIHVSVHAPMAPNSTTEYIGIAGEKPYIDASHPNYFIVHMVYNAKIKATGKWKKMTSGYLNVRLNCDQ